jgi:translation elongation factor EF-Tu-like GTPase
MPITLRQPHIEAEISFIATDAGGRESAARSGYRPSHDFGIKGILNDAAHEYLDSSCVEPGCKGMAKMWFLSPEYQEGRLCPGFKFTIQEGQHVVGYGIVTKVINKSLQIDD